MTTEEIRYLRDALWQAGSPFSGDDDTPLTEARECVSAAHVLSLVLCDELAPTSFLNTTECFTRRLYFKTVTNP